MGLCSVCRHGRVDGLKVQLQLREPAAGRSMTLTGWLAHYCEGKYLGRLKWAMCQPSTSLPAANHCRGTPITQTWSDDWMTQWVVDVCVWGGGGAQSAFSLKLLCPSSDFLGFWGKPITICSILTQQTNEGVTTSGECEPWQHTGIRLGFISISRPLPPSLPPSLCSLQTEQQPVAFN